MNYLNVIQYLNILKNTIIKNLGFWLYLFTLFSIMIGFLIYIFYLKAKIYLDVYSNFNRNYPSQRSNPPKKSFSTQKLTLNGFKTIETTITDKNEKQNDNKLEITDDSQTKIQKIGPYYSNENEKSKK